MSEPAGPRTWTLNICPVHGPVPIDRDAPTWCTAAVDAIGDDGLSIVSQCAEKLAVERVEVVESSALKEAVEALEEILQLGETVEDAWAAADQMEHKARSALARIERGDEG